MIIIITKIKKFSKLYDYNAAGTVKSKEYTTAKKKYVFFREIATETQTNAKISM